MNISPSGNVGIGTDGPEARLTVTTPTTGVEAENIRLEMNTSVVPSSAGLNFRFGSVNGATIYGVGENGSNGASSMRFYTHNGTSSAERMRITSNGIIAFNGSSTPNSGGLDKLSLGFADGAYGWIQTWSGRPLTLNSEGNNVLIGTTTDLGYRLQVAGTISQSEYTYHGNNAAGNMNGATWINTGLTLPTSNLATYEVYAIGNENNQNQCVRIYFIYYNTNIGWTATLAETNVQPTGNDYGIVNIRMTSGGTIEVSAANSISTGIYRIVVMNQFKN
jgi:hypothetical protein